ncbi:hypothetical protein TetV_217 [Tetraselmis virus 1]|uniref:Uncharacterized protein n=1 Tax=Tetraselmis virus 1 TaxID=2060617 RepID=A0A2P0VNJ3_9VIRU|nr:hypothetical protein QJ968_gp217 [Tetraselmis virus 1]AUF82309.1 hypothetical protein TetV_217 [Tetraselmis virus 1]
MSKYLQVGTMICIVDKLDEEDNEFYWDRAWTFSTIVANNPDNSSTKRNEQFYDSFKKAYEARGLVYDK